MVYYWDPYEDDPWNDVDSSWQGAFTVLDPEPEPVAVITTTIYPEPVYTIYSGAAEDQQPVDWTPSAPEPEPVYSSPSGGRIGSIAFWTDPDPVITEEVSEGVYVTRPLDTFIPEPEEEKGMGLFDKLKAAVGAAVDPIVDTGGFLVDQAGSAVGSAGDVVSSVTNPVAHATALVTETLTPILGVLPSIGLPIPKGELPSILPSYGPVAHHAESGTGEKLSPMNIPWGMVALALGTVALAVVAIRR